MSALTSDIGAGDRVIAITGDVASAVEGGLYCIDDELIVLDGFAPVTPSPTYPMGLDRNRWRIQRGARYTAAVAHAAGASVYAARVSYSRSDTLAAPSPVTGTSAGGGPHTHAESEITSLVSDLAAKAPTHTHPYAATSHAHPESDVTNLTNDLAGKAASGHNHDASYAPTHSHPYAATSHAHVDADLPAGLARDAEVAAAYAPIHSHPYEATGAVAAHAALADPHPVYLTSAEGAAAYEALGSVATHAAAGDPHPVYLTSAEGNAAYAVTGHTHGAAAPVFATLANGATAMALGTNDAVKVTPTGNATYTTTVPAAGKEVHIIILTSGTSSWTITFGTGFKPVGTLATGTTSARVFVLAFISDGTNLYEKSRTAAMVA